MKGKGSNENKGYAFVTYRTKEMAAEAITSLNNTDLKVSSPSFKSVSVHKSLFSHSYFKVYRDETVCYCV